MTVNNLIYKLTKYFSWLYFRHWERWELLIIVLISLVLLLLIIWQQRKTTNRNIYANRIRERSPIIGVKLADTRSRTKIEDLKKYRSASLSKKHTKQKKEKEQLEKFDKQIQLLQLEISKHKHNEARLEKQIVELKAANKELQEKATQSDKQQSAGASVSNHKLQQKMTGHQQAEQYPKQQIIEKPVINKQPQQEFAKSQKTRQTQTGESKTLKNQSKNKAIKPYKPNWMLREKTGQVRIPKELREEPLDVQKLKAIAELAKKIQGQRRK
jgi:hypothetical protein